MVKAGGENFSGGEQSGNHEQDKRDDGRKVLEAFEQELDALDVTAVMDAFPQGADETSVDYLSRVAAIKAGYGSEEEYKTLFGERYKTEEEEAEQPETESAEGEIDAKVKEAIEKYKNSLVDRYGNTISQESVKNLLELAQNNPDLFEETIQEVVMAQGLAQRAAEERGYQNAQKEIATLLNGRTPEQFMHEYREDIALLEEQIAWEESHSMFFDEGLKRQRERHLEDARGTLASMKRKFAMVANLQRGEDAVPVGADEEVAGPLPEELREQEVDARAAMIDLNDPEYNVKSKYRRAAVEEAVKLMSPEEGKEMLKRLENVEMLEREMATEERRSGFAGGTGEGGAGTDEEVAAAAAAAGGTADANASRRRRTKDTAAADARQQAYDAAMAAMANEAKTGRFDENDEELSQMERMEKIKDLHGRLKGRVPFRKRVKRFFKKTALALMTVVGLSGALSGFAADTVEASAPVETGDAVVSQLATTGASAAERILAQQLSEDLGVKAEDLFGGELNFAEHDLLAEGEALYEGFMEQEGSFMTQSGMMMNATKYNDPNRHGNSFAASIEDLRDDKEALADALLENMRELPYQLASMSASMPELLRACGVDESIVENPNVAERAQAVMDLMLSDGGGDLQKKLLAAQNLALHNENTVLDVYQEYGQERTFYVAPLDMSKVNEPGDIQIKTDVKQRNGNWQVQIDVQYADGAHEKTDVNLGCGGQVNMEVKTYIVRIPITDEQEEVYVITTATPAEEETTTTEEQEEEEQQEEEQEEEQQEEEEDDEEDEDDSEEEDDEDDEEEDDDEEDEEDEEDDEDDEDDEEEIAKKNPDEGERILNEGEKEGELEKTENVEETGVGETTLEQDTPEEGNQQVVVEEMVADNEEDAAAQEEVDESWSLDNGLTEEEENDEIDSILGQMTQRVEADQAAAAAAAEAAAAEAAAAEAAAAEAAAAEAAAAEAANNLVN